MIALRETVAGTPNSWQVLAQNFIMIAGPIAHTCATFRVASTSWRGIVTTPFTPWLPSSVAMWSSEETSAMRSSHSKRSFVRAPTTAITSFPSARSARAMG